MKAVKRMATIDEQGQLTFENPIGIDIDISQNSRVEVIVLIPEAEPLENQTQAEVLGDFRQAWHEAMNGQTIPAAQLWEGLKND
jgi:bifunctional DNA-binding transcriptional regulator/antitoxin component of YhaV-PrlF toxin-antitoxin module